MFDALLMQNSDLADKYDIAVENADPEQAWSITRDTILTTAAANIAIKSAVRRPWLATETMDIIDQKKEARLQGNYDECKRLKYKARSKVDLELFYGKLTDEAESGFRKNNL